MKIAETTNPNGMVMQSKVCNHYFNRADAEIKKDVLYVNSTDGAENSYAAKQTVAPAENTLDPEVIDRFGLQIINVFENLIQNIIELMVNLFHFHGNYNGGLIWNDPQHIDAKGDKNDIIGTLCNQKSDADAISEQADNSLKENDDASAVHMPVGKSEDIVNSSYLNDDFDKEVTFGGPYDAPRGTIDPTGNVRKLSYLNPIRNPRSAQSTSVGEAFQIEGSNEFKSHVSEALNQLKAEAPDYYKMVFGYVGRFKEDSTSGMYNYENPPTFHITLPETNDITWLKSIIVHDSWHSAQIREGMFGYTVGDNLEKNAIDIQTDYLKEIGEERLAAYGLGLDGSHWRS